MFTVHTLPEFDRWFSSIQDRPARIRLLRRLDRFQLGQWGDVKPVGDGVMEAREHFGPGWRMYYIQRRGQIIVMLAGGDKSRQEADIAKARKLAQSLGD
ncbi:MAG: type II toxin-antitoxin system RelE/ParE family toxin [Methylococcus sp.]